MRYSFKILFFKFKITKSVNFIVNIFSSKFISRLCTNIKSFEKYNYYLAYYLKWKLMKR